MPFVGHSDSEIARKTLEALEGVPELATLEAYAIEQYAKNNNFLTIEDSKRDELLTLAAEAFITKNMVNNGAGESSDDSDTDSDSGTITIPLNKLTIDPSYSKGALKLTHEEGDQYKLTHSAGRWAFCKTSDEEFFIFPNGDIWDIINPFVLRPFAPSEKLFNLPVKLGDEPKEVTVYGYGGAPDSDNTWSILENDYERERAHWGGVSTILFEFAPHILSIAANLKPALSPRDANKDDLLQLLSRVMSYSEVSNTVGQHLAANDPFGMIWPVVKNYITLVGDDREVQRLTGKILGISFAENSAASMVNWRSLAFKAIAIGDAYQGSVKTLLGWQSSRYKTTFTVENVPEEATDFGNIIGLVYDGDTNLPLPGATVIVEDGENNPLNPSVIDTTNESGAYFFENILVGARTITASKTEYESTSVNVNVISGAAVEPPIIVLQKKTGNVYGRVLNDILVRHNVNDGLFQGLLDLKVKEIGGNNQELTKIAQDGYYSFDLLPGKYQISVNHDDYSGEVVEVTVVEDEDPGPINDILLYAKGSMTGTVKYDRNNDGIYESESSFFGLNVNATDSSQKTAEICMDGTDRKAFIRMAGFTGEKNLLINIDSSLVTSPDLYTLGAYDNVACGISSIPMGLYMMNTNFQQCNDDTPPQIFLLTAVHESKGCNCGIEAPGEVILDEYGDNLTDVIAGTIFSGTLAGWKGCSCNCKDEDNDGIYETCTTEVCERAQLRIDFRVIVGSAL